MDAYLSELMRYLVAQSGQIAVLTTVVAVATFALRRRSAHVRYLFWLVVLAKCLVPPLYLVPVRVLPETMPERVPPILSGAIWTDEHFHFPSPAANPLGREPRESVLPPPVPQTSEPRLSVSGWLGILWIAGAGGYLMMNLLRALRGRLWLRRTRRPLPDDVLAEMADLLPVYGIRRLPRIWIVEGVGQPFVWGLLRGSIYVPAGFFAIESPQHRRDVLAHELSHVLRFDPAVNTLQVVAQALFWFHPFVWWANRKIRQEREKACDEIAVAHLNARPKEYSAAIVSALIQAQESTRRVPSLAVAGPVKNIEERIRAMLRPGRRFYKRPSPTAATVVVLLALLTVPTTLVLSAKAQSKAAGMSLHKAAADGDIGQLKSLISKGADVNEEDDQRRTALHWASEKGHIEVATFLISHGADVNASSWNGMMPLHCAAASGSEQTIELLLSKGAYINAKDRGGSTSLLEAMKSSAPGRREVVELLVAKGARIPALHLAAYVGDMAKVKGCLQDGIDLNSQDDSGATVLHAAANSGNKNVVEFLLEAGAAVDAKNTNSLTPLYYASVHGYHDIVDLLLAKGAALNAQVTGDSAGKGMTPLHFLCSAGATDLVEWLIAKGADINVIDSTGRTPLHIACLRGHRDTAEPLIAKGADVNIRDNKEQTALALVKELGFDEIAALLRKHGEKE